jgi:hypothetical protein
MNRNHDSDQEEPTINFGGEWIPAHDAWKKMETATVVVDAIDHFNEKFPHLASSDTRDVVPLVRKRLKDVQLRMPSKAQLPDLSSEATSLLETLSPEDVVASLRENHGAEMDMLQFVRLVGDAAYLGALRREAEELQMNRISADQTAQLWNELSRPAPGGGLWSAHKVEKLIGT